MSNKLKNKILMMLAVSQPLCSCSLFPNANKTFSPERLEQVNKICNKLGANNFIYGWPPIDHNGSEPIYVAFHDNFDNSKYSLYKPAVVEALDYMFTIAHDIDQNYKYKIIPISSAADYNRCSVIQFDIQPLENHSSGYTSKSQINDNWQVIVLDSFESAEDENHVVTHEEICGITKHELGHVFGFKDIYDLDFLPEKTMMMPLCAYSNRDLYPNDYALMLAYLSPQFSNTQDLDNYISNAQEKLEKYTVDFYNKEDTLYMNSEDGKRFQTYVGLPSCPTELQRLSVRHRSDSKDMNLDITLTNNTYSMHITSSKGYDHTLSGDYISTEHFIHLVDVDYSKLCGYTLPLTQDMLITQTDNNKIHLFNASYSTSYEFDNPYDTLSYEMANDMIM